MRKQNFIAAFLLVVCMAGCANEENNHADTDNSYNSGNTTVSETAQPSADRNIDEKIDENLYVQAEFHMPKEEPAAYSSKLKKFNYDKVQSVFWPDADAGKVKTDEFGGRSYGDSHFGGEDGTLGYEADEDITYVETLCSYAMQENIIPKKNLKFATVEKAADKVEEFISKFDIGCEPGEPSVTALNGRDLNEVQKKIMEDDTGDVLRAKNLGNKNFDSGMEVYYFEYPFVLNHIHVFGNDDPTVRYTGDGPLIAQNMGVTAIVSKSGIERLTMFGVLDRLAEDSGKAKIIGYEGIKEALKKKFGDVILADKYKVTNIWMEYFPLIQEDSFNRVNVIPVWCCDFEINEKTENYTLRFNAVTGEEIS